MRLKQGQIWKHYKGGMYQILTLAKNSQTDEEYEMVVYQDVSTPEKIWTQSLERFLSTEQFEGKFIPRFTLFKDAE